MHRVYVKVRADTIGYAHDWIVLRVVELER